MASDLVISNLRGAIVGPVSLRVSPGACAAIEGPSGAGKSLLLRMIADLDPNEGEVRLGDMDRAAVAAPAWRRQMMLLAAESGWWAATVEDHFPPERRTAAGDMARRLGLEASDLRRAPASFSTGERQRLALIRALVRQPRALLLDEPTSALDAASVLRVEALLREVVAAGAILVLVSHDQDQARRLATARYAMSAGRLAPA